MNPLATIVIPVFNGANYVSEAIESALAQTYRNIEILVVNDGSSDDGATDKAISKYLKKIKYIKKTNGGVSSALNVGIREMSGEYFSWLSHDDLYTPDKIAKQVDALSRCNDNTLILCDNDFVDAKGERIQRPNIGTVRWPTGVLLDFSATLKIVFAGCSISGCSLLVPRKAFEEAGLFNESYRYMQDMDMWYRILMKGYNMYVTSDLGVHSRVHAEQLTVNGNNIGRQDAQEIGMNLIKFLISSQKSDLLYRYACLCYRNNMTENGRYIVKYLRSSQAISLMQNITILRYRIYGKLRPLIRKLYYKFMWNINLKHA